MTQEGLRPRWRRYVAEVLAIVVGILLALAADAGRQYLTDRAAEREILAALRVEFAADVTEIEADQDHRAQKLAAIDRLSEIQAGLQPGPPPDSLAADVLRLLDWRFYTASHPVLDDIQSTGRIGLIRSAGLRRALMAFGQERSRIAVTEQQDRELVARQVEPFLAARVDLETLASSHPGEARRSATLILPPIVTDATFRSLLYLSRERTMASRDFAARLRETVSTVQKALEGGD